MRILYLCHRIPYPPDKGDKIRAFQQVRALGAEHEVDVFTLADNTADLVYQAELRSYCRLLKVSRLNPHLARLRALAALLRQAPLTIPYFHSTDLAREVRTALRQRSYDRIVVYCSAMSQYVENIGEIPVLVDFVDVDSDKWFQYAAATHLPRSLIFQREGRTLREYERKACERSGGVVVTTDREARLIREIAAATTVHVIPNGVDTKYFTPSAAGVSGAPTVGFTGDMSYFPNQNAVMYFARQVFPLIRRRVPATRFLIVGRNPGPDVRKLREIEGVEVTGAVPDVRPYLARMQVSVAPFSIASGIQNKVLEAMACGIPVVATSRAVQGLSAASALAVEVADSPREMAERIVRLLVDSRFAQARGMEGRCRVTQDYNWERSMAQFLKILAALNGPRRAVDSSISRAS